MNGIIFLLLSILCVGFIYIVHKFFGKHEFYVITVIYSIISFIMSFKLVSVFGININMGSIFSSGIIMLLYYFVNRFDNIEVKRFIAISMISIIVLIVFIWLGILMIPSIYDENLILFRDLFFENIPIIILYPLGLFGTLLLSSYSFKELKKTNNNRSIKTILTFIGIIFVDVFIFIYFSYAFIIKFDAAILMAIGNYFIKIVVISIMYFLTNRIMRVKKVRG